MRAESIKTTQMLQNGSFTKARICTGSNSNGFLSGTRHSQNVISQFIYEKGFIFILLTQNWCIFISYAHTIITLANVLQDARKFVTAHFVQNKERFYGCAVLSALKICAYAAIATRRASRLHKSHRSSSSGAPISCNVCNASPGRGYFDIVSRSGSFASPSRSTGEAQKRHGEVVSSELEHKVFKREYSAPQFMCLC